MERRQTRSQECERCTHECVRHGAVTIEINKVWRLVQAIRIASDPLTATPGPRWLTSGSGGPRWDRRRTRQRTNCRPCVLAYCDRQYRPPGTPTFVARPCDVHSPTTRSGRLD